MKKVILIRHGRAIRSQDSLLDLKRLLIQRGEREADLMAKAFKKEAFKPDLMISSPADRALATAKIFARRLGVPVRSIQLVESLYYQTDANAILEILHDLPPDCQSVMIFGHNPSLTEFAGSVIRDFPIRIPKAGVVGIEFDAPEWKQVRKNRGKLTLFDYPVTRKEKAVVSSDLGKEISKKLDDAIRETLDGYYPSARKKLNRSIKKTSKKMSRQFMDLADHYVLTTIHHTNLNLNYKDDDEISPAQNSGDLLSA